MKRTTIFLDPDLEQKAKKFAYKNGVSLASVIREALAAYVVAPRGKKRIPSIAGAFRSGHSDTAERAEELLWTDPHK